MNADLDTTQISADKKSAKISEFSICEKKDNNKPIHFAQMNADFNTTQISADKKSARICEFSISENLRDNIQRKSARKN